MMELNVEEIGVEVAVGVEDAWCPGISNFSS